MVKKKIFIAIRGFDPRTFGYEPNATAAPNRCISWYVYTLRRKKYFTRCVILHVYIMYNIMEPFYANIYSLQSFKLKNIA